MTGGNEIVTDEKVTTSDVYSSNTIIYAQWTLVTYTIRFNAGIGTVSPTSGITGDGWKLASLPTPTKSGYTFDGWYTSETGGTQVTASTVFSSSDIIYAQWTAVVSTFTDSRDGKTYKKVTIGGQTWMAENLDMATPDSKCYENSADSCAKYGRLYTWSDAMNGASSSEAIPSGVQGVCPAGWHLPSRWDWESLVNYVGPSVAGWALKSTSGWGAGGNGGGPDAFWFSALPGGSGTHAGGFSYSVDEGLWWSGTQGVDDPWGRAWRLALTSGEYSARLHEDDVSRLLSVRCVQDN